MKNPVGNGLDRSEITKKPQKPKMQFSKKLCVYGMFLVTMTILGNFILIWFGRPSLSDIAIAVISMFGGFATGGYFALSGVRDCSKNKHGKGSKDL